MQKLCLTIQQPNLPSNEAVLVGYLYYHFEYFGGYVFKEILSFEDLIDEITKKHLIGDDLINSDEYETVMFVRCIENSQEELNNNEFFWEEMDTYPKKFNYIYSHYCTSQLNKDKINDIAVKKALNML